MEEQKNYFDALNVEKKFFLNEADLKKNFFARSRELHPDFHTQADEPTRDAMLEKSVRNTQAYRTLSDFDSRVKYILELEHALNEENKNAIPADFLMEMLDFNEEITEAKTSGDAAMIENLNHQLETLSSDILQEAKHIMLAYDADPERATDLTAVRNYFLKKKYLRRLKDNLTNTQPDI